MAESNKSNTVEIKHDKLIVAAIDFGTTYSGYAICTSNDYQKKPNDPTIFVREWNEGTYITNKAPTCVLFNPDKQFDSFGYVARNKYRTNPDKKFYSKWFYFENFKMMLLKEKDFLTRETMLEEFIGVDNLEHKKRMRAMDVFAAVIAYLKDDLLQTEKTKGMTFTENDIQWVLTVPAIWDLKARKFMRDAAEQAGIPGDQLTLALEPEAASIHCRRVPVGVTSDDDGSKLIAAMEVGSQYVVLDQGGGTTDIVVHEVTGKHTLKEIKQACGGHWGGITVNGEFHSFLIKLLGGDVINEVKEHNPSDYFQLLHTFEHAKTSFTDDHVNKPEDKLTIRLPCTWLERFEKATDCKLKDTIKQSTYKGRVVIQNDKMRMKHNLIRNFFDYSIDNVLDKLDKILKQRELVDVHTILIVGGHSKSTVLTNAIAKQFGKTYNIVVPKDPDVAILKGAVLFGFNPDLITSRVSQYTYGVAMQRPFKPGVDAESKKKCLINGLVDNVFDKHVEIGQIVNVGEFLPEHDYVPASREYQGVHFEFYATEEKNPVYVTDKGCCCIGVLYFELTEKTNRRDMTLKLNTSGTEIVAIITERSTGKQSQGYFSLF